MKKLLFFIIIVFCSFQNSFALQKAKPIASDNRIRTYVYNPNDIFVLVGHYRYQTSIEFEKDETILTISLGDSLGWQITPQGNRIFIKPIEQDATTNMTVITNKRTYFFELYGEEAGDIRDPNMVFVVRFVYGNEQTNLVKVFRPEPTAEQANQTIKPDLSKPENYNFNYTLNGSEQASPVKVFDDGEFTFFQFRDKNSVLPGFFEVDPYGQEALVNYRIIGDYVVVERVSGQFTLRNGEEVVCVFNENRPLEKIKGPDYSPEGPYAPIKRKK